MIVSNDYIFFENKFDVDFLSDILDFFIANNPKHQDLVTAELILHLLHYPNNKNVQIDLSDSN